MSIKHEPIPINDRSHGLMDYGRELKRVAQERDEAQRELDKYHWEEDPPEYKGIQLSLIKEWELIAERDCHCPTYPGATARCLVCVAKDTVARLQGMD